MPNTTLAWIQAVSDRLTDVLHESRYNQCHNSDDTCATRLPAAELTEILFCGPTEEDVWTAWHTRWYHPEQMRPKAVARRGWRRLWHGSA